MSALTGKPLEYLIGIDDPPGKADYATEGGYDSTGLPIGVGIGYVNRRQEEKGRKPGISYIDPPDDVEQQYGEPAPTFGTPFFWANIDKQCQKWRSLGFEFVEIDNIDVDTEQQTIELFDHVATLGLYILAKNATARAILAHPFVVALIQEHDDKITAAKLNTARAAAGKPALPVRVVTYDDQLPWAERVASDANAMNDFGVTFSPQGEYESVQHLLRPRAMPDPSPIPPASPAPWADTLRADVGRYHDGPDVPMLAQQIARTFPDLASYCAMAGQATAWCGIYAAFKLSRYGLRPPHTNDGVGGFMWVDAWLPFGTPVSFTDRKPGDLALWINSGGLHHISFVGPDRSKYIGGNQSNSVTETSFPTPSHLRRPPPPENYVPTPDQMPMLMIQSTGDAVRVLQTMLGGIEVDGEFGPDTEAAVKAYQVEHSLEVDGIVGPETWASLYANTEPPKPQPPSAYHLTPDEISDIMQLAGNSAIARYSWKDRGVAPLGFTKGMAVMYAQCVRKLGANDSAVLAMSAPIGSNSKDALAYYTISASGRQNVLRKLFVMLYGLGMRESSGNYTEGRDTSASNVTSDTAEAGLFQQSWNSSSASNEMKKLLPAYEGNKQPCYSGIYREGITLKNTPSFGGGDGYKFQELAKSCPAFATEMCAVGLRVLYNHWGPVVRQEVEMRAEAEALLLQVDAYLRELPIPPEPEPEPPPLTDLEKAKMAAMDAIETAIDKLIVDVMRIEGQAPQITTTGMPSLPSMLPSIPPAVLDSVLRFAWPHIARLSADQIIGIKDKITAGEFGIDDVLAIVSQSGASLFLPDFFRKDTK